MKKIFFKKENIGAVKKFFEESRCLIYFAEKNNNVFVYMSEKINRNEDVDKKLMELRTLLEQVINK